MKGFSFTTCLRCRGSAWRDDRDGQVFCQPCDEAAERLQAALASVARPPAFQSLRSALRGTSNKTFPVQAP